MLFIGFNMLTMTLDHYQQSETFSNVLDHLNMIFIVIFSSECLMKVFALRYHYFVEPWNLFDFVVVILSILGEYPLFACPCFLPLWTNVIIMWFCFGRFGTFRHHWKIFCISNVTSSSASSESRSSLASRQGRKGYSNTSLRAGHVVTSALQHLFTTLLSYVYLRHFWNVVLYERQGQEWPRRCLQLQDFRTVHDPTLPGRCRLQVFF